MDVEILAERARALVVRTAAGHRALLGLTGPPGAGKSTLAEALVAALVADGLHAVLVPMDGFHLAQCELERLDLTEVKGAPSTFDAPGYVALLERLRYKGSGTVYAPQFRREVEEPIAGAIAVEHEVDLVVTEGNYLLLPDRPWDAVHRALDEVWYLDADPDRRRQRLAARHRAFGRDEEQAWQRTSGSDEANAVLVEQTRDGADLVVDVEALALSG